MRTSETFRVGDIEYQVNMWSPDKAIEDLAWLIKLCGESITSLFVQVDSVKDLLDMDVDFQLLAPAIKELFTKLNEKEVSLKVRSFCDGLHANGVKVQYETYFMGRIGHLMKVVLQILKAQYKDFFDGTPEVLKSTPGVRVTASTPAN